MENYSDYISDEKIYELIDGFDKTNINVFTELEQIKLASFFLNYNKSEMYHVSLEKAKELVDEWNKTT